MLKSFFDICEYIPVKSIKKLLFIPFCLVSLLACTPKPQLASEPTDQKSIGMYSQNIKRGYAELQRRNDPDIAEINTLLDQLNGDSGIEELKRIDDLISSHLKNTKANNQKPRPVPDLSSETSNKKSQSQNQDSLSQKVEDASVDLIMNAAKAYSTSYLDRITSQTERNAEKRIKEGLQELISLNDPKIDEIYAELQKLEGAEYRQGILDRVNYKIKDHLHELRKPDRIAASSEKNTAFFNDINQIRQSAGVQAQ